MSSISLRLPGRTKFDRVLRKVRAKDNEPIEGDEL